MVLSPGGHKAALIRIGTPKENAGIWLRDLRLQTDTRLTLDGATEYSPVWSPDESRLAFSVTRDNSFEICVRPAAGQAGAELVLRSNEFVSVTDWSEDGRFLVYQHRDAPNFDLWLVSLQSHPITRRRLLHSDCNYVQGQISPDERWLAYVSMKPARQRFTFNRWLSLRTRGGGCRHRAASSRDGGVTGANCFMSPQGFLMSIAVRPGARFQTGPPIRLFPTDIAAGSKDSLEFFGYSPAADRRHFLIRTAIAERPPPVTVIVNWSLPGGLGQEDSGTDPSLSQHP